MMTLTQARERAASRDALTPRHMPLQEAIGSVLLGPVLAQQDVPHVATSAMDGWALAAQPLPGPAEAPSWSLRAERVRSPAIRPAELRAGEAAEVLTGSPVPAGTHTVLRTEHGCVTGSTLRAHSTSPDIEPHRNIRAAGTECLAQDQLVPAGTVLTPARAAVAAVAGYDRLEVIPRPRVHLVLTGTEVITSGVPAPGEVRDVFGLALPQMLQGMGAAAVTSERLGDDPAALAAALTRVSESGTTDLVITSGGTAHSRADALRPALELLGAELEVDAVQMRPGHPVLLARLGRPDGPLPVLGLPGNPLAGFSALAALGGPLLAALRGLPPTQRTRTLKLTTAAELPGAPRGARLLPVRCEDHGVVPAGHSRAHMMRGLAEADALAIVPQDGLERGETVHCLPVPGQPAGGFPWDA